MSRLGKLGWIRTIDDSDLKMEETPVHLCEFLIDLAAESLDFLVERTQALSHSLDVRPERLGDNIEVPTCLSGRRIYALQNLGVQDFHVAPCLAITGPDLLPELGAHLLDGGVDLLPEVCTHERHLLPEVCTHERHLLPEVVAEPVEVR